MSATCCRTFADSESGWAATIGRPSSPPIRSCSSSGTFPTDGRDGMVHVFNGPGLGADIDFKLIERKKIAVLS